MFMLHLALFDPSPFQTSWFMAFERGSWGLYLSGEHWGSHEQSTWSIFMCYNLSTSHQLEYISRFSRALSGRGSVGFTTVIAGTESISDWDASPTGCDWPRPPNFCFFPNTLDTLEFSGYSSLSPFRLLYIYIYIYMWICIAPCLDKHAIYDIIIYIYRYALNAYE